MKGTGLLSVATMVGSALAWAPLPFTALRIRTTASRLGATDLAMSGNLHGQNSCFLPLKQLDQDYYAPRIIQIAGAYPGLTREEFFAVTSEPAAEEGQWTYDFSDPEGPQLGTVAVEGSVVSLCEDPAVIIAEHPSMGVELPKELEDPVDLVVVVDRALKNFAERKFLVVDIPGEEGVKIQAFPTKADMPVGTTILGQVELVQIPWLPCMKSTKTGFMEVDEYF